MSWIVQIPSFWSLRESLWHTYIGRAMPSNLHRTMLFPIAFGLLASIASAAPLHTRIQNRDQDPCAALTPDAVRE